MNIEVNIFSGLYIVEKDEDGGGYLLRGQSREIKIDSKKMKSCHF